MSPPVVLIVGEEDAHVALVSDALAKVGVPPGFGRKTKQRRRRSRDR